MVDPNRVDDRLGGEEGRRRLFSAAAESGLGVVVDLVPNHMAVSLPSNRWLWDVLCHGRASRYADYFDVDWEVAEAKVLLPVLGDHYGRELEAGAIRFVHDQGTFVVAYHDHRFPASPASVAMILESAATRAGSDELAFLSRALCSLSSDTESRERRHADHQLLTRQLREVVSGPDIGAAVDASVEEANHDPDVADALLDAQHYRLARWRVTEQEIGYRRFFDIDELIGLRVEDPAVFSDTHRMPLAWLAGGEVQGLRIDHPDGLRRPGEYLRRLRSAAPQAWIVVEKILGSGEALPDDWPVDGTTGYEFISDVTALFVDPDSEEEMTRIWEEFSGSPDTWGTVMERAKRDVLESVLAGDLNRLTEIFVGVITSRRRYRDFTRAELSQALAETLVAFDVYRTYLETGPSEEDRGRIEAATARAREAAPDLDSELFDLLRAVLVADLDGPAEEELRARFQQLSGPVMAKGVEDTAFYRYLRLAALCEVGGDPGRFALGGVDAFHQRCRLIQERHPTTMLALTTHDTKRSEDVRARLAALTEIPERWGHTVRRWRERYASHRPSCLDGATEYLIYQTLVGAHPIGADRLLPYLEKATKEAKVHTSWTSPDEEYDAAVARFAGALCADAEFQAELADFVRPLVTMGRINSLVQKTLQLTAPGVPDIYQGTELWDLSLVDPDNRRPVDHALRRRRLSELKGSSPAEVLSRADEGLPKLWVTQRLLELRARRPEAFGGDYVPLAVEGPASDHVVAYSRGGAVAVVVPRLTRSLRRHEYGGGTRVELPPGRFFDVFSHEVRQGVVAVGALLTDFPVSVLERA